MSDSTKCFSFLKEHVPKWQQAAAEIQEKVVARQTEMARVPVRANPLPKRTGSNESIRIHDLDAPTSVPQPEIHESTAEFTAGTQSASPTPGMPIEIGSRKRKPASLLTNGSLPTKYRSRSMIIVYYDSEVQKGFEQLVRHIGTGRNMLRKGKMQARVEAFEGGLEDLTPARETRRNAATVGKTEYAPKTNQPIISSLGEFRKTRNPSPANANGLPDFNSATGRYDTLDKALEKAQSLAEKGAHQFLRDGDCREEIDGIKSEFNHVLTWVDEIIKLLGIDVAVEEVEKKDEMEFKKEVGLGFDSKPKPPPTSNIANSTPVTTIEVAAIEVDSDVEEEVEIILPPIRRLART